MRANNGPQMTPTLIVTRPAPASAAFADSIRAAWGGPLDVIISPLLQIVPVEAAMPAADALILTSVNGVEAAARLGLPQGMPAWCVGGKTARAAAKAGFAAQTGPGDAAGLRDQIIAARPKGTLAHIRGTHTRGEIAPTLQAAGIPCADVVAYDQQALPLSDAALAALGGKSVVILPLFSPRTGVIFTQSGPYQAKVHAVAISAAVADAVSPLTLDSVTVAGSPDAAAMQDAVLVVLQRVTGKGGHQPLA